MPLVTSPPADAPSFSTTDGHPKLMQFTFDKMVKMKKNRMGLAWASISYESRLAENS